MKKADYLRKWILSKSIPTEKQSAQISVHFKYIDEKKVMNLSPKERVSFIDQHFKKLFQKMLLLNLVEEYELIGTKRRPTGIKTIILLSYFEKIRRKLSSIGNVNIDSIKSAKK